MRRILTLLLVVQSALIGAAESNPLHNTFYLEGERITYVLVMRADKTFDIFTPTQDRVTGTFRTREDDISFHADGIRRAFRFDLRRSGDLEFKRHDNDVLSKGHALGMMPPTNDKRLTFTSEENWVKKKRPLFNPPAPTVSRTVPPETDPWPTRIKVPASPSAFEKRPAVSSPVPRANPPLPPIRITSDASAFNPLPTNTSPVPRTQPPPPPAPEPEVSAVAAPKPALPERSTVPVTVRPRVEPPPPPDNRSEGDSEQTQKTSSNSEAVVPPTVTAPLVVVVSAPPVEVGKKDAEEPDDTAARPSAVIAAGKRLTGVYVYKPNPFIAESLMLSDDGKFEYTDSNGVTVKGTARADKDVLKLVAGDVEREFSMAIDGSRVTLTRTAADTPRFANDLATMSPSVSKSASYEKK